jgi:hypothetical protein
MTQPTVRQAILLDTLALAVPMWMDRHDQAMPDAERAEELKHVLNSYTDDEGTYRGSVAEGFNALAEALALCARAMGGVDFFGTHWCESSRLGVRKGTCRACRPA